MIGWGALTHPQTKMESECNPTKSNDGQIHWEQHFLAIGNRKRKPLPYETRQEDQRCDLKTPSCICHWCCSHHQQGDLIGGGKKQQQQSSFYTKKGSKLAGIKSNELSTYLPRFFCKKPGTSKIKIEKKEKEELREKQKQFNTFWQGNKKYVLLRQKKQPRRRTPEEGQQTMALMIAPPPPPPLPPRNSSHHHD